MSAGDLDPEDLVGHPRRGCGEADARVDRQSVGRRDVRRTADDLARLVHEAGGDDVVACGSESVCVRRVGEAPEGLVRPHPRSPSSGNDHIDHSFGYDHSAVTKGSYLDPPDHGGATVVARPQVETVQAAGR